MDWLKSFKKKQIKNLLILYFILIFMIKILKLQQETIGTIGTNLIHACFNEDDPKVILARIYDNLEKINLVLTW